MIPLTTLAQLLRGASFPSPTTSNRPQNILNSQRYFYRHCGTYYTSLHTEAFIYHVFLLFSKPRILQKTKPKASIALIDLNSRIERSFPHRLESVYSSYTRKLNTPASISFSNELRLHEGLLHRVNYNLFISRNLQWTNIDATRCAFSHFKNSSTHWHNAVSHATFK